MGVSSTMTFMKRRTLARFLRSSSSEVCRCTMLPSPMISTSTVCETCVIWVLSTIVTSRVPRSRVGAIGVGISTSVSGRSQRKWWWSPDDLRGL